MKLIIQVTDDDIRNGQRRDCTRCPIANALQAHVPLLGAPLVFRYGTGEDAGEWYVKFPDLPLIPLPREAGEKAHRYDREGVMEPFAFRVAIRLPDDRR